MGVVVQCTVSKVGVGVQYTVGVGVYSVYSGCGCTVSTVGVGVQCTQPKQKGNTNKGYTIGIAGWISQFIVHCFLKQSKSINSNDVFLNV